MSEKKQDITEDIIYSREVIEFITVANEFCLSAEGLNSMTREEYIINTYKILTLLQLKALTLPKPEPIDDAQTESFINEADWHFIDNGISTKLGSFEIFSDLREPIDPLTSIEISISECLADTYQDLKDFTQLYQFGNVEAITQGLWECKTNFEQVWGPRIMIVIREFHLLIYGEKDLTDEKNDNKSEQNILDN